jgi:hypothetical protein
MGRTWRRIGCRALRSRKWQLWTKCRTGSRTEERSVSGVRDGYGLGTSRNIYRAGSRPVSGSGGGPVSGPGDRFWSRFVSGPGSGSGSRPKNRS